MIMLVVGLVVASLIVHGAFVFIRAWTLAQTKKERRQIEQSRGEADQIIQQSQHTLQILAERETQTIKREQKLTKAQKHFEQVIKQYARSFEAVRKDSYAPNGALKLFDTLSPKEHVLFDTAYYLLDGNCSYRKLYQTFHERDADTVDFVASLAIDWDIEEATQLKYSETFIRDTLQKKESIAEKTGLVPIIVQEALDTFYLLQGKQGTSRRLVSESELIQVWQEKQRAQEPNMDTETAKILAENKVTKQAQKSGSISKKGAANSENEP